jgi:hypothetical protein
MMSQTLHQRAVDCAGACGGCVALLKNSVVKNSRSSGERPW